MRPVFARARRPVIPNVNQTMTVPAPMGGINAVAPLAAMPPEDCVLLWNMYASEFGNRARLGYREWLTGLEGAGDDYVRTMLPFKGSAANGAADKLFSATSAGLFDVTDSGAADPAVLSFSITSGRAGHGICCAAVASGGHYLFYADEENGLHRYSQTSGLWEAVAQGVGVGEISGVDPANVVSVLLFKGRLWLVEKDTSSLYYLAAGAVAGVATAFPVGAMLAHGGPVRNLAAWTYDGGSGLDDSLVILGDGGDVLIYQGSDPDSSDTWMLRGAYYAGDLPAGRELAVSMAGDLWVLTRLGLLPLSNLVKGVISSERYATSKISPLFNAAMLSKATLYGWTLRIHPEENALIVTVPEAEGVATTQFAMVLTTGSWSRLRDLPIYSCAVFGGKFYFGTTDGRVCINDGYVDGRILSDDTVYTPVQYAGLSAFSAQDSALRKQVQQIRPYFVSESAAPDFDVAARYDFDLSELSPVTQTPGQGDVWDSGLWDEALWSGEYAPSAGVRGAVGMGTHVAIAWRGVAVARTVLVAFDVEWQPAGGFT